MTDLPTPRRSNDSRDETLRSGSTRRTVLKQTILGATALAFGLPSVVQGATPPTSAPHCLPDAGLTDPDWTILNPEPDEVDGFGDEISASADGETIHVAAKPWAYVFRRTGSDWTPTRLVNPDSASVESVALSDDGCVALVGAPGYTSEGWESNPMSALEVGRAYVFSRRDGGWDAEDPTPIPFPVPLDDGADQFGWKVALDPAGTTALIGAWRLGQGDGSGEAYLFGRDGTGWNVEDPVVLPNPDPEVEEMYSRALALDADGTTALVGDPGAGLHYWSDGDPATGAAYVYTRDGGEWNSDSPLTLPSPGPSYRYSFFGRSVALTADGRTAFVGARLDDVRGGAVHAFDLVPDPFPEPIELNNGDEVSPVDHDGDGLYEDLNGDGTLDGRDVSLLTRLVNDHRKGRVSLTDAQVAALDFDGGGILSKKDVSAYNREYRR
jgi:hypothetical protein